MSELLPQFLNLIQRLFGEISVRMDDYTCVFVDVVDHVDEYEGSTEEESW